MTDANGTSKRRKSGNRRRRQKAKPVDLWRPVPPLPEPEPILPGTDPAMLLRSLGEAPLHGQGVVAEHYMAAVIERAAGLATALAASADLLADTEAEIGPTGDDVTEAPDRAS